MEYIKEYLNKCYPLMPKQTSVTAKIDSNKKYKAFIFDIYGTLLISSSGDIDEKHPSARHMFDAFWECGISCGDDATMIDVSEQFLLAIREEIKTIHSREKGSGNEYPEVIIEEVWDKILQKFFIVGKLVEPEEDFNLKKLIFLFECRNNSIWPMPGMKEIIEKIHSSGKHIGIVSNAQYYTPLIINHFLNGTHEDTDEIIPFNKQLVQYSYQAKKGKPDISLFKEITESLNANFSIQPSEAFYIGNDMLNDICPADKCGMDTILFAGDKRSLRLREDDPRVSDISPTHIITELSQLVELI